MYICMRACARMCVAFNLAKNMADHYWFTTRYQLGKHKASKKGWLVC